MKVGRNEPCPCGSGKKYKKCCLRKSEGAPASAPTPSPAALLRPQHAGPAPRSRPNPHPRAAAPPAPPLPPAPPKPPPDPHVAALDARWKEFEGRDYEGRVALFLQTLDDPELLDDEIAFEML